jgi:glycosyltransferase involved in cell wall biosynthesis
MDSIDTTIFHPQGEQLDLSPYVDEEVPVITFMGKQGANKGIYELIAALDGLSENFRFLVVTGQNGIETLQKYLDGTRLEEKTRFLNFMPPWRIPSLMRASTCVVHPERVFGVKAHSPRLPREVMATGTCLVLGRELYDKLVFTGMKDGESVIVVDPEDIETFRQKLRQIILNPTHAADVGHAARKVTEKYEDFSTYLDKLETMYTTIKG